MCAVLQRWRYSCIDDTKRAVNACMGLYCSRAK
nr:MAG TPA_asm: conotoxin [Caudoviricetes sp.]